MILKTTLYVLGRSFEWQVIRVEMNPHGLACARPKRLNNLTVRDTR